MPGLWPPDASYNASWIWLPLLLGLGSLSKSYRLCWGQLLLPWEVWTFEMFWKSLQHKLDRPLLWRSCWKRPGPRRWVGWGDISGNHLGELTSVSQVNREQPFGICLCPASWVGVGFNTASTSIPGEICLNPSPTSPFPEISQFSSSSCMSLLLFKLPS